MANDSGPWMFASPSTSGQANKSCFIRPVSLKTDGFRFARRDRAEIHHLRTRLSCWVHQRESDSPSPEFHGSTVGIASAVATAASIALPPASRA